MTPEELEAVRERDAKIPPNPDDAKVVTVLAMNPMHAAYLDRRALLAEVDRLRSWDGLMELLNEHWPTSIFPMPSIEEVYGELYRCEASEDGRTYGYVRANPGVRIVGLMRWLDRLRAQVARVEALARAWDEIAASFYVRNRTDYSDWQADACIAHASQVRSALAGTEET